MVRGILAVVTVSVLAAGAVHAAEPAKFATPKLNDILPLLNARSPDTLEGVLRSAMIELLPNPLYAASPNWGRQREASVVRWNKEKGLVGRPEIRRVLKNDGTWRKYVFTSRNLPDTLVLDIRDVTFPEPLHMHFGLFVSFDAGVEYTHHVWESGVRLYAGSVRARLRPKLLLRCAASAELDTAGKLVPDAIFRLQVTHADLTYDNLVVEHVPGIGGTAAKLIGEAFQGALREWRPEVERELFAKANAAILRAGQTREVRVNLHRVFEKAFGPLLKR